MRRGNHEGHDVHPTRFHGRVGGFGGRGVGAGGVGLRCRHRAGLGPATADAADESRAGWVRRVVRVCRPVVDHLAAGTLRERMPVECPAAKPDERRRVTHLEAVGRTLAGLAPWLSVAGAGEGKKGVDEAEARLATELAAAARRGLANMVDPKSPDRLDFAAGGQNLVDAAFLCLGLLRAPDVLWDPLPAEMKKAVADAVRLTRKVQPPQNNWLLFAAVVEAWLASVGEEWKADRVAPALQRHAEWYKGDGAYGDGPSFHWDYYNSYVIHPMLVEVVERLGPRDPKWAAMREPVIARACAVRGRPRTDGRAGWHLPPARAVDHVPLRRDAPPGVHGAAAAVAPWRLPAAGARALAATIRRTLDALGTFDDQGWLRVGFAGHQPSLAEPYISTGSLYLCTAAFLPLGLPPSDPFWSGPAEPWTQQRIWAGADRPPTTRSRRRRREATRETRRGAAHGRQAVFRFLVHLPRESVPKADPPVILSPAKHPRPSRE